MLLCFFGLPLGNTLNTLPILLPGFAIKFFAPNGLPDIVCSQRLLRFCLNQCILSLFFDKNNIYKLSKNLKTAHNKGVSLSDWLSYPFINLQGKDDKL
jgi:hypothetical protein